MNGLSKQEVIAIFTLAGIQILNTKPLPDGYGYSPEDSRYFQEPPYQVWWFVKTKSGWIEIGWRKRVINIDWSDTPVRQIISDDDVTKDKSMIHAWSVAKAIEYLQALKEPLERAA